MTETTEYEITQEEALRLKLLQAELEKATLNLQLVRERAAAYQRELAGKYSEYGRYDLIGELNLETRKGLRQAVPTDGAKASAAYVEATD